MSATVQVVVMAAMVLRCLVAMLVPHVRQPGWPDVVVALAAAVGLVVLLTQQRPTRSRAVAAGAAVLFWTAPALSAAYLGQAIPVASLAMALVAAVVIVGPSASPWPTGIAVAAGVFVAVASLVAGLLAVVGLTPGALYGTADYQRETLGLSALAGIAGHPNTLAQGGGFTFVLGVAWALVARTSWVVALLAVTLLPLLWSQSRTSIAASLLAAGALWLMTRYPRARPWVVAVALASAVLPPALDLVFGARIPLDQLFTGRPFAWRLGELAIGYAPWTGNGPDVMSDAFWARLGRTRFDGDGWLPLHAHNEVLETVAQSGLWGAVTLLALVAVGATVALRRTGRAGALAAAVVLFLGIQSGVEVPLGLPYFPAGYLLPVMAVAVLAFRGIPEGAPGPPGGARESSEP